MCGGGWEGFASGAAALPCRGGVPHGSPFPCRSHAPGACEARAAAPLPERPAGSDGDHDGASELRAGRHSLRPHSFEVRTAVKVAIRTPPHRCRHPRLLPLSVPRSVADNQGLTVAILVTVLCLLTAGSTAYLTRKPLLRLLLTDKKTTVEKLRCPGRARVVSAGGAAPEQRGRRALWRAEPVRGPSLCFHQTGGPFSLPFTRLPPASHISRQGADEARPWVLAALASVPFVRRRALQCVHQVSDPSTFRQRC